MFSGQSVLLRAAEITLQSGEIMRVQHYRYVLLQNNIIFGRQGRYHGLAVRRRYYRKAYARAMLHICTEWQINLLL